MALVVIGAASACGDDEHVMPDASGSAGFDSGAPVSEPDSGSYDFPCLQPWPVSGAPTFSAVYHEIFCTAGCVAVFCHGASGASGGMNLETLDTAYAALVGAHAGTQMPVDGTHGCTDSDLVRVDPGHPERSLLYLKVNGAPPCGMPMPQPMQGWPALSVEKRDQIKRWITLGAIDDRAPASLDDAGAR